LFVTLLSVIFSNEMMILEIRAFSTQQTRTRPNQQNCMKTSTQPLDDGRFWSHHRRTTTTLFATTTSSSPNNNNDKKQKKKNTTADFEYQELQIQMQAMKDQNVKPSQLTADKRVELEGYARRIVQQRDSMIPLGRLGDALPGTKWRMAFSTEPLISEALPKDATITLDFVDDKAVDYALNFDKTLGLKKLTAKSSYAVDVRIMYHH
jgi:hypothetical protein